MHFSTTVLLSVSLALATRVFADVDAESSPLSLRTKPVKTSKRAVLSLLDRRESCSGTCKTCFGPNYVYCPESSILCYDPTKGTSAEQCSAGSSNPPTPTSSSSAGGTGVSDICFKKGANCQSCFGTGSISCPSGSYYDCYEPASYSVEEGCNPAGGSASPTRSATSSARPTSTTGGSGDRCAEQYGPGNILCDQDSCYNPDAGETCCGNGKYCRAGTVCINSGSDYKCRESSGSGSLTSDTLSTRTSSSSGITNPTGTPFVLGNGDTTPSDASRTTTRSTASRASSSTLSAATAVTTSPDGFTGAAGPLGADTGACAALAAGLLAVVGLL